MIRSEFHTVEGVINWHLKVKKEQKFNHVGYDFVVHPQVFCPFVAPSGTLSLSFATFPNIFFGKKVIEVGCGSGIISSLIALNGAERVLGIDKNDKAIFNAVENKSLCKINNCEFRKSDLFEFVDEEELLSFDIYFADLPLLDGLSLKYGREAIPSSSPLSYAFFDENYFTTITYIKKVASLLKRKEKSRGFVCLSSLDSDFRVNVESLCNCSLHSFIGIDLGWVDLQIFEIRPVT